MEEEKAFEQLEEERDDDNNNNNNNDNNDNNDSQSDKLEEGEWTPAAELEEDLSRRPRRTTTTEITEDDMAVGSEEGLTVRERRLADEVLQSWSSSSDKSSEESRAEERRLHHIPISLKPGFPAIEVAAGGEGKGSTSEHLNTPHSGFRAASGDLYVSDTLNHRVQKWRPLNASHASVETVAGGYGPGRALNQLRFPKGVFLDASNNLFVADSGNHRVVRWSVGARRWASSLPAR
ncbi:unnamed protein product [Polarella glacialis]|uniref:Uncharacterized protein n=1 Tax=Polarella glacialis TaxID=89957 RepID=A0A813EKK1_POLGL|nr:unnamed protein product [Polarella glacialis]